MASVSVEKEQVVKTLGENFSQSSAVYLVNFQGCTCADLTGLRRKLRPTGASFEVIKNTMACLSIEGTAISKLDSMLSGPTAAVWAKSDIVAAAKVLKEFSKDRENFSVKGGVVDGQVVDASSVAQLADLPSKEQLLSKLLALINAPATRLLQTINAPAQNLINVLDGWRKKLEGQN